MHLDGRSTRHYELIGRIMRRSSVDIERQIPILSYLVSLVCRCCFVSSDMGDFVPSWYHHHRPWGDRSGTIRGIYNYVCRLHSLPVVLHWVRIAFWNFNESTWLHFFPSTHCAGLGLSGLSPRKTNMIWNTVETPRILIFSLENFKTEVKYSEVGDLYQRLVHQFRHIIRASVECTVTWRWPDYNDNEQQSFNEVACHPD